jgi:hypothetical protein
MQGMSNGDGPGTSAPASTMKSSAEQKGAKQEGNPAAASSSSAQPDSTPAKPASTVAAKDPYTPGAGAALWFQMSLHESLVVWTESAPWLHFLYMSSCSPYMVLSLAAVS